MSIELEDKPAAEWIADQGRGQLEYVDKKLLDVDYTYQRNPVRSKIELLSRKWEWRHCGVLVVARRNDGTLWVIDGQHRLAAAFRRNDITHVPCVIFESLGQDAEASEFLGANVNRKPLTAIERHRAAVIAKVHESCIVQRVCDDLGLRIMDGSGGASDVKCVGMLTTLALERGEEYLRSLLSIALSICRVDDSQIDARLLRALFWLGNNLKCGINDRRLAERLKSIGEKRLSRAIRIAVELYGSGGDRTCGLGVLEELNKGLRNKFTLKGGE